ncbi:hypothetical protein EJ04DRAFT_579702 [Polyplosphaeria fusca]|uniref:Uncharacterized protein n=1 Tax=Polyplosphaeria fusca TaxID=682080 RepID=A0A9P4UW50_9PLEO|nr:hypothetical protein EJ04DRAFT_579702 [Polyplosphaeria fusca]
MNYAATSCPLPAAFAASRNQSTFIKDEELKPQLEDRVGTPHPSELSSADDIGTQPQAEKLNSSPGVGGLEGMENSIRPEQHEELEVVEKTWLPPGKDSFQFVDAKGEDMMAKGVIAFDVPGSY